MREIARLQDTTDADLILYRYDTMARIIMLLALASIPLGNLAKGAAALSVEGG